MKNGSKFISLIFLFISISFLIYVFYRAEIYHGGYKFKDYYFKYYIFSIALIIFSIISFFIKKETKIKITLVGTSTIIGLYILQTLLLFKEGSLISDLTYDTRDVFHVYKDLQKNNPNIVLTPVPRNFLNEKDQNLFPITGISKKKTIGCNENGYYSIFDSDRYGFNNPDEEWNKKNIEFLLVGDSMVHGSCVNPPDTIGGNLRKLINSGGVLSLGQRSNGPLIEYATLKEYLHLTNVKRVLWVYFEGNDLVELSDEMNNEILIKYINNENYNQKLYLRQNEINDKLQEKFNSVKKDIISRKKKKTSFPRFLKLYYLRKITFERFFVTDVSFEPRIINNDFKKILKLSKSFVEENNAKLYFIYIPEIHRYIKGLDNDKIYNDYENVINFVNNLKIPIIDINIELFSKQKDKLSLYPFRSRNHFTEKGYRLVTEAIFNKINMLEKKNEQ